MIAAIMQPYFFPYIGYFQLMNAVNLFIFYDDAQYMKGGWVNRNRILAKAKPTWLTLPVKRDNLSLSINQRYYLRDNGIERIKQQLCAAYAKAPAFSEIFPYICNLLDFDDANVATFNANLLKILARKFGARCNFKTSSEIDKPKDLRGEAKVLDLCQRVGATHYINAIGGLELYNADHFDAVGIQLSFLQTTVQPIRFEDGPQYLSIIDNLMRSSCAYRTMQLSQYNVVNPERPRSTDSGRQE